MSSPEQSSAAPRATVHFRSLGCPKNLLDTEVMLGALATGGYALAGRLEDADVAVVNTCSFIESAREESIEAILEVAEQRQAGRLRALVVAGCLPQRYGAELARELPEVDAFVGTGAFQDIAAVLDAALAGQGRGVYVEAGRTHLYDHESPRILTGPGHSAYLKLAEGCDRICAFCAIPGIRGRFQSRTLESVLAEARQLAAAGVREINLVAQDSTAWGKDLPPVPGRGRPRIEELLQALDEVEGLDWIRLLYVYPGTVSDELLQVMAGAKRILPYIDVPLQHASDRLLRLMRRGTTRARQRQMIARIREALPHATLRTTFIVGFPGETDEDFQELCDFVREMRFDRLGAFRYSDEDGTSAAALPDKVPQRVARQRYRALQAVQQPILREKLEALVGTEQPLLVDARLPRRRAAARLASQAPDIDGVVHLAESDAHPGQLLHARITKARPPDLEATPLP